MGIKDIFRKKEQESPYDSYTIDEEKNDGMFKVAEGVMNLLNVGKKEPSDNPSDKEIFVQFLKDYLKEIRKDR